MDRYIPKVGEHLYLTQFTGNGMVDMVKSPFTVIESGPKKVKIQECKLIWPVYHCTGNPKMDMPEYEGKRVAFYNTVAESIEEDPNGRIEELTWHSHRKMWGTKGRDSDYPEYAIFGRWEHQPYLD